MSGFSPHPFNATSRSVSSFFNKVASSADLACGLKFAELQPGSALRKTIMAGNCLTTVVRRPRTEKPNSRCLASTSHHTLSRFSPTHTLLCFRVSHSIISSLHSTTNRSPIQRAVSHLEAITASASGPPFCTPTPRHPGKLSWERNMVHLLGGNKASVT